MRLPVSIVVFLVPFATKEKTGEGIQMKQLGIDHT